ncbi:sodium potassium-transporting ATPase subunit beta [Penaeus vannamei]|uniref:Sodium potassium-transporting ATPase subunit beta n=1 Tax=Penaeus vannamei TaxID=6689 RepID=A0A3R7PIA5_PENVA|nr:sodium potassium-transporting ATPase subunit beta [Penaeus vannamei]
MNKNERASERASMRRPSQPRAWPSSEYPGARGLASSQHEGRIALSPATWRDRPGPLTLLWLPLLVKIGVFYLIFYACLAGFFAIMMAIFYQTLDVNHLPKYTPGRGDSILKNPAMGFRPLPRAENVESTLVWYKNGDSADIQHWVESLNEFIKPYEGTSDMISGQHVTDCSEDKLPGDGEVCRFQDTWLKGKCQKARAGATTANLLAFCSSSIR